MVFFQGKEMVIFQVLTVSIVLIGMAKSQAPQYINYTCGEDGVTGLQQIGDIQKIMILSTGPGADQGKICKPNDTTLASCSNIKNKKHFIVIYDEESAINVIDHNSKYYDLECTDKPSVIGQKATVFTAKSQTSNQANEKVNIHHVFELKLMKNGSPVQNPIHIGDELKLQMLGTDVIISPLNCSAYPDGKPNENITIWRFNETGQDKCFNDHASIISLKKWNQIDKSRPDIEVTLYAFRFVASESVQIECYARVCSTRSHTGCSEDCIKKAVERRRRSAPKVESEDKYTRSSSISFAIKTNENRANSSPGLSIGLTKFLLVALTLKCVYFA